MSTNQEDDNGQNAPINAVPKVVDVRGLGTGDLIEAMVLGVFSRKEAVAQLNMAQMAAQKDPTLSADLRFQAEFKNVQKNLEAAIDGCNKIKNEINLRFESVDAERKKLVAAAEIAH